MAELQNFNFLSSSRWETRFCDPETPNKCLALTLCTQNGVGTNISGRERKFSPRGEKRSRGLNRWWPGSSCICLEVAILHESKGGRGSRDPLAWGGAGDGGKQAWPLGRHSRTFSDEANLLPPLPPPSLPAASHGFAMPTVRVTGGFRSRL